MAQNTVPPAFVKEDNSTAALKEAIESLRAHRGESRNATLTPAQREAMASLRALGGAGTHEEDIVHEGTRFVLPANLTTDQALRTLKTKVDEDEKEMIFSRTFQYRPWDGAHAVAKAFKRVFGMLISKENVFTFFGETIKEPPETRTITVGVNQQEQVPWGNLEVPTMPGALVYLGMVKDKDKGPLFSLSIRGPRKYRFEVEGIFRLIEEELQTNSIYHGKAIDGAIEANFLDLSGVNEAGVTYSEDVQRQLDASIWTLFSRADDMRALSLPLKRAVLLEGEYGTGKTLAAFLTAKKATAAGWTFLYVRPKQDNLKWVMQTARLYQPAVVFVEDMDTVEGAQGQSSYLPVILDIFDGITSKGTEIVLVTTTNHPDKITPAMLRPGRLDAVIHIGALDAEGVERLIRNNTPAEIDPKTDFFAVVRAMEGYPPAFVKEASDRAVRYALVRGVKPDRLRLSTQDFVDAANDLRPQYVLMNRERSGSQESVDVALARVFKKAWDRAEEMYDPGDTNQIEALLEREDLQLERAADDIFVRGN